MEEKHEARSQEEEHELEKQKNILMQKIMKGNYD